jgi:mersacidin/lichenicidin family type 2 lantibiotic
MSNLTRAWKDEMYRQSLSTQEQTTLSANPAGAIELTQAELEAISGAIGGSGRGTVLESDETESKTEQVVTYYFGLGTATTTAPAAPMCNNTASPASSRANLLDL